MDFTGKNVVVTGSSKGIGLAVVEAFVELGANVVASARSSSERIDSLVESGKVTFVAVDLGDPNGPSRLVEGSDQPVDVLVNNVGAAAARLGGFLSITDEEWVRSLELNFLAAVRTTRAVIPKMIEHGGAIVNIVSVNAELPDPTVLDYGTAKAALANFTKGISAEYGPQGIRANAVNPGPVGTDLWLGSGGIAETVSRGSGSSAAAVQNNAVAGTATRRFSTAQEVAALVVFLASDSAANITGAGFRIDGGLVSTI